MRYTSRHGFSLMEVIVGFILISFLTIMVGGVVVSAFNMSMKLNQLPNTYYGAQDMVEEKLDNLESVITEKYRIENELLNAAAADPELTARLSDINTELREYEDSTVNLFGKSVKIYRFSERCDASDGSHLTLTAGLANEVKLERPVPIIDEVIIREVGNDVEMDLFNGGGKTISASVNYNSKNYDYYYADLYQWYVCTGDFHTAPYPGDHEYEELLYGTVFAQYPNDFTPLTSCKNSSITIDESYTGKFLVCAVTPLSINGKMGEPVISNYIYVSALPALSSGKYELIIEPSITQFAYDPSGALEISSINSRYPATGKLTTNTRSGPNVILEGANTNSSLSLSANGTGDWSRYINFTAGTRMVSSNIGSGGYGGRGGAGANILVFAVARNNESYDVDFISSGSRAVGFATNSSSTNAEESDTGWQILMAQLPRAGTFTIGGFDFDVAELIVVSNASGNEQQAIWNYLSSKYHIS